MAALFYCLAGVALPRPTKPNIFQQKQQERAVEGSRH
jgi:hypothetical protein